MIQAPRITSLRVKKLAANFINMEWDNVGGNFYYIVERRIININTRDTRDVDNSVFWQEMGVTSNTFWFDDKVSPGYTYKYRIRSTYQTFIPSDWVESDDLKTFPFNAYVFTKMNRMTFSDKFLNEKFIRNNQRYVDFDNDQIMAGLMGENFSFNKEISDISSVSDSFVVDKERHEVQGHVGAVCKDRKRTMIAEIDGVLYLFEHWQPVVKVSNDKGQNWVSYRAFNGRVGKPIARQCTYQSSTTTFVLGYEEIFFGRPSTDIRWSDDYVRMSTAQHTFAKLGDDNNIGFPVEIFGKYIGLPADLNKRAEAMASSSLYLYVGGRNYVRRANLVNPPIDELGDKIWDEDKFTITADPENRSVVKKLDFLNGKLYALISGRVDVFTSGAHKDPTDPKNVKDSEFDGIYVLDEGAEIPTWTRVFGNTEEERLHIVHEETNMSTDGTEVFFDYINYTTEVIEDKDLPAHNPVVESAVKYSQRPYYATDKKIHQITFRTKDIDFQPSPVRYYGEPEYTWGFRGKTRAWIAPSYNVVVVYPTRRYEYIIDEDKLVTQEIWDNGDVNVKLDNIKFTSFSSYANGVMIYKSSGEVIGYYEFNYRARDQADIYWKPDYTLITAELIQQVLPEEIPDQPETGLVDPDLSPLLNKMAPEHYMPDGGLMRSFADNYLQYLSTGEDSFYNKLKNLIRNKYPREENNFEYLYSEINKRNIYLDKAKRDATVRFFESRANDFYSTKGVVDSYKFLFKLLYNADVDLEVESLNSLEYDVVVQSGDVTEDIVGTTVYTPTGRANVTYIEREYENGVLQWRITIHNLIGKFIVGQVLKSEVFSKFSANIVVGVRGKELTHNDIDYINRGRVQYTMTVKSELSVARYKDDVLRFVHPVGFGFRGITLITVLINSGLSLSHKETIMNIMKSYRWDAGLPTVFPESTYQRDALNNLIRDPVTGSPIMEPHPHAGENPLDQAQWENYNEQKAQEVLVDPVYKPIFDMQPSERRHALSPTLDAGWLTYCYYSILSGYLLPPAWRRLKDNHGLPRDPVDPNQFKV
jgi:hypothetical protein